MADPTWPGFYRDPAKAASYEERRTRSWWRRLSWRRELALAGALVAEAGGARWLDLACGPGRTLSAVPSGAIGVDLSYAMLALGAGRARERGARLVCADATRLPFPDGAFEGVLALRFVHHLTDDVRAAAFAEMRRVATRSLVVSFPGTRSVRTWTRRLRGKSLGPRRALDDFARELDANGWRLVQARTVVPLLAETTLVLAERA